MKSLLDLLRATERLSGTLLKRREVRASLTSWAEYNGYRLAAHHTLICEKLEALARGEIKRVAVFTPPGAAKSTYCSVLLPAFYLAQHPTHSIISASHTVDLALRHGRKVRGLITRHGKLLGIELADDNAAAGRWALTDGGEFYAAGVGVGIAGFRADLVVVDDPFRSRADADSELIREGVWEWFKGDLITRLKPGGRIVLIQTRWHLDDLAGRILTEMEEGKERWEVISIPAEAEENDLLGRKPGEWLWDDDPTYKYGERLRHEKIVQTPRNWSALYQQRPVPDEGNYFLEEWFRPYTKAPDRSTLAVYGGSDYAVTSNGGDYTCHVVVGLDPQGRLWLLDLWRRQASTDVWIEALCDLVLRWKPIGWAEEQIQITSGVGPFLERRLRERQACVARRQFPTRGDKAVRAQSIRGRMALNGLYVPINAPWYPDFRAELLSFPASRHDDQVDAVGLTGQLLDKMALGSARKIEKIEFDPMKDAYRSPHDYVDVQSSVKLF